MLPPLVGAFLRVDRAEEHFGNLRSAVTAILEFERYAGGSFIKVKIPKTPEDHKQLIDTMYSRPNPDSLAMPPRLSILVGEIIYNLRSALDYLVYDLAAADSGKPVSGTQFPIEDHPNGFEGRKDTFLKGINPTHIAAIERLQPCNGCDWTKRISRLSNPDKHRHLTIMSGKADVIGISQIRDDPADPIYSTKADFREDTMYVRRNVTIKVGFDDGTPVIETLEVLKSRVAQTLEAFQSEFK